MRPNENHKQHQTNYKNPPIPALRKDKAEILQFNIWHLLNPFPCLLWKLNNMYMYLLVVCRQHHKAAGWNQEIHKYLHNSCNFKYTNLIVYFPLQYTRPEYAWNICNWTFNNRPINQPIQIYSFKGKGES